MVYATSGNVRELFRRPLHEIADSAWKTAARLFKHFQPSHTIYSSLLDYFANIRQQSTETYRMVAESIQKFVRV